MQRQFSLKTIISNAKTKARHEDSFFTDADVWSLCPAERAKSVHCNCGPALTEHRIRNCGLALTELSLRNCGHRNCGTFTDWRAVIAVTATAVPSLIGEGPGFGTFRPCSTMSSLALLSGAAPK